MLRGEHDCGGFNMTQVDAVGWGLGQVMINAAPNTLGCLPIKFFFINGKERFRVWITPPELVPEEFYVVSPRAFIEFTTAIISVSVFKNDLFSTAYARFWGQADEARTDRSVTAGVEHCARVVESARDLAGADVHD